jgi:hypothetical protein
MRTIPRSLFKSYAKDLLLPIFELVFQHRLNPDLEEAQCRYNVMILAQKAIVTRVTPGGKTYRRFSAWILA